MDTLQDRNILFLGGGHMAAGIIHGLLDRDAVPASNIYVIGRSLQKLDALRARTGVNTLVSGTAADSPAGVCDTVILAVPPQAAADALAANKRHIPQDALMISVCAGVTIAALEEMLRFPGAGSEPGSPAADSKTGRTAACSGAAPRIIRVMPNTLGRTGHGYSALCASSHASNEDIDCAEALFSPLGRVIRIQEDLFDAFTAFSCSGPAYALEFIGSMTAAGVRAGLSEDASRAFVLENLLGTAGLLQESGEEASAVLDRMCTPGGVTETAVSCLRDAGFSGAISDAVSTAYKKAGSLGR